MSVKRECESVSEYMAQMKAALDNVVISVDNTIKVADQAFLRSATISPIQKAV